MAVILLMLGVVIAVSGLATIGFGIPISEFTLGTTLIVAGTTALTGGLVLVGLAVAVTELGRIAEALRDRVAVRPAARDHVSEPAPPVHSGMIPAAPDIATATAAATARTPQAGIPLPPRPRPDAPAREAFRAPEPYPVPSAVEVSAAAIERLRSSIPRSERSRNEASAGAETDGAPLSPDGASSTVAPHQFQPPRPATSEAAPAEARAAAEDRAGGAAVEALKASRLDFLFRSRPPRPAGQLENPETHWPAEANPGTGVAEQTEPRARAEAIERRTDGPAADRRPDLAIADAPRAAAILKSGVVDGMAYTLYADGSIEAKLPHGTVRFGSIAELRAHIESNS
jgi:hypothetical protein